MPRNTPDPLRHDPRIANLIGFNLQMATLRVMAHTREALADAQVSPAKITALSLLQTNPGCDQSALGRALQINRASAMKLVNSLSARGLVERRKGRNLRTYALYLTEAGEHLLEHLLPRIQQADAQVTGQLTQSDRETFRTMLDRLGRPQE